MSVNVKKFRLAAGALPLCPNERREYLDAYFDDLLASAKAVQDGWEIDLNWPSSADYYIDPHLEQGLDWWCPGIEVGDIYKQVAHSPSGQLSLNDSWTLYSWSHWLRDRRDARKTCDQVVILHVDDHTDLMTPRLTCSSAEWRDAITGDVFDIYDPKTVRSAILSGAIGVGSFMSPFLHSIAKVQLRHLSQTIPVGTSRKMGIATKTIPDTLLLTKDVRPSVVLINPAEVLAESTVVAPDRNYLLTASLGQWLADIPKSPILLHIDMDYFSNRFDGDSDWEHVPNRHDPSLERVIASIDDLFSGIVASEIGNRIENITVGISPRFFPSEFWAPSIVRLNEHFRSLGFAVNAPGMSVQPTNSAPRLNAR
jgi:hypothetical protein